MLPVTLAFSSPPMRCSRPGVPGIAQGRASVSGLRLYASNGSPSASANAGSMRASASTSGISHGSAPFARYASDSTYTGVRYVTATRTASIAAKKQSPGDDGAMTGTGDSELRPNSTISRSPCSGLVGIPVDGPARWTSMITSGSSSAIASPTVSDFRTTPGPAEVVTPSEPPNAAPSAAPAAAISSSAWNVRTPNALCLASSSRIDDAGVIGYAPRNSGSPDSFDAAISPYDSAWLPVMLRYVPGASFAGFTS